MLYNIAETEKAYDKCHHLLCPSKSNETSHFYQMDQSFFRLQSSWVLFFIVIQILIEHHVSKQ